jgi:hypothetical protein
MRVIRSTAIIVAGLGLSIFRPLVASAEDAKAAGSSAAKPVSVSFFYQHVKFLAVDGINRYRYIDKGIGKVTERDLQYKLSTRVQVDLVGDGTTYIQGRGESGRSFTSSYDYTSLGMNKGYWSFDLKSLFVGQRIGKRWEAQAGGIEYDWGAGTEATYADNDGWLTGYRFRYAAAAPRWLPDKVSVTVGYVGDFTEPNVFARFHRMGDENYIQILGAKKFGKTREVSAEFDSIQEIRYTREALRWQKLPFIIVDELSAEAITRASDNPSFGWSSNLFKTLDRKRRVRLGVFYSDVPRGIFLNGKATIFQNGDSYSLGKRIGPTVRVVPFKNFELTLFGSDRLDNTAGPRYRGQLQVRYQFAGLLNRMREPDRHSPKSVVTKGQ